jgi:tetraacyldisaccharide-1-P 4'-kinase
MLRESTSGLRRADAMVITRASQIDSAHREQLMARLGWLSPRSKIYCCDHVIERVSIGGTVRPARELSRERYVLACGIGNPAGFVVAMESVAGPPAATHFLDDHHDYVDADVRSLRDMAARCGAGVIVVTEKDWVKLKSLTAIPESGAGFCVAELELRFLGADRDALIAQVMATLA